MHTTPPFPETQLYIDGVLRTASHGATYPDISPWDETEIGRAAEATPGDMDAATAAEPRTWGALCEALGLPELLGTPLKRRR